MLPQAYSYYQTGVNNQSQNISLFQLFLELYYKEKPSLQQMAPTWNLLTPEDAQVHGCSYILTVIFYFLVWHSYVMIRRIYMLESYLEY